MIRFRIIFITMAVISFLLIQAPLILGFVFAVLSYHGECYGFTDGSWPCSWGEYVSDQVFWSALLEIPLSVYLFTTWLVALGLWLYKRRTSSPHGLTITFVVLIPMGGYLLGSFLISIFSVFIRYFYWLYP